MRGKLLAVAWCGLLLGLAPGVAGAWEPQRSWDDPAHAGKWYEVACLAVPTDTGHYVGYYVGGGKACWGDCRCVEDGTWGWDYEGVFFPKDVILRWSHGRKYQGGLGAYRTVGKEREGHTSP
jgi:hypothetical protein